jgi:hypothetical protein
VARITDAIADMSKPPPGCNADFVFVQGLSGLNAYLVERRAEITLPLLLAIQRRTAISRKPLTPFHRGCGETLATHLKTDGWRS